MSQQTQRNEKSLLNPAFRYVPSASTDIRKTFERARKEIQRQQRKQRNER